MGKVMTWSAFFSDIIQRRVVSSTDVWRQRIGPFFKYQNVFLDFLALEDAIAQKSADLNIPAEVLNHGR
jgi:hypothetical protein